MPAVASDRGTYSLALGVLGVWRVAHLIAAEDGPWDVVVRLRKRAGQGQWGELMDCFECLSIWTAVPFAVVLGDSAAHRMMLWPALSAGAILLEHARSGVARLTDDEEEENDHVVLR